MKRKQIKRALAIICAIIMMLSTGLSLAEGVYVYADDDESTAASTHECTTDCTAFFESLATVTDDTIASLLEEVLTNTYYNNKYDFESMYDEEGFAKFIAQAMSYENILKSLDFIDECNYLRTTDDNFTGLSELKVSPSLMLASAVSAYFAAQYQGHSASYALGLIENLSYNYKDPFTGWYTSEKEDYDNGDTSDVGHYKTICNSALLTTGFCYVVRDGSRSDGYWAVYYSIISEQSFSSNKKYLTESYTTDELRTMLAEYFAQDLTKVEATDATCTEDGNIEYYVCPICGVYLVYDEDTDTYTEVSEEDVVIAAGHDYDYENGAWAWTKTDDGCTATYTVTCKNDSSHTETYDATVTSEATDVTCTTAGTTVYTATVTVDETKYTDSTTVTTSEATGHDYDYDSGEWTWTETDDGYTVTYTVTCNNDSSHTETYDATVGIETTDATCTTAGTTVYTATVTVDGAEYTDSRTVEGEALGHSYSATITFNDDYTATVTVTCANDDSHSYTAGATVTSSETSATCTEAGKIVYTASYSDDNVTAEDVTVTVTTDDATGHDYDYDSGEWTWTKTDDGYTATYTVTCNNDSDHTVSYEATVTSTEQEDGSIIYAAAVYVSDNDETYTDTYTVAVEDEEDGEDSDDDSVQTSDNGNIAMMGVILLMAIVGCAGVAVSKRR